MHIHDLSSILSCRKLLRTGGETLFMMGKNLLLRRASVF